MTGRAATALGVLLVASALAVPTPARATTPAVRPGAVTTAASTTAASTTAAPTTAAPTTAARPLFAQMTAAPSTTAPTTAPLTATSAQTSAATTKATTLAAPARRTAAPPGGVLVIGVAGLTWHDVGPATPTLQRLAATGAVGALSVKALPSVSCPADGWLTLGAGARAQAYAVPRDPCTTDLESGRDDVTRNARSRDGARLGALATALQGAVTVRGPGAELTAAGGAPGGGVVTVVDAGTVGGRDRLAALAAVDATVAADLTGAGSDTDVLVVGLSEGPGESTAQLHVAMATGPDFPRGGLRSPSTGRTPYVQLVDVAPTVLSLLGEPVPDVMDGQPWRVDGPAPSVADLDDLDTLAVQSKRATVPFFVIVLVLQAVLLVALRRRPRPARLVALVGTAVLGASYAANLVPWWRTPAPLLALLAVSLALAAAAAALAARTSNPVGWVCAGVATVIGLDLVTGATLQMGSVAGYSALVAGRFAGIGNVAFGVYATGALLGTALLAGRRPALVVALAGLAAVAVDGAPPWGSDVGGVLALLPAFVVLGLLLTGTRVSVARLVLAALAGAAVVVAFALADHARPAADRTHLGRFVDQVRDGTAGDVLHRKASAVLGLLFHSPVTALLPLVVAAAVWLVVRPPAPVARAFDAVPALRHGLLALGVACLIGFAVNDSGAAVPALALAVAVPATTAAVLGVALDRPGARKP